VLASETTTERYGKRKGLLVHRDDLDDPGRFDLPQRFRSEKPVSPVTDSDTHTKQRYDAFGDPLDADGNPTFGLGDLKS
jgi:hypothetical protein